MLKGGEGGCTGVMLKGGRGRGECCRQFVDEAITSSSNKYNAVQKTVSSFLELLTLSLPCLSHRLSKTDQQKCQI